MYGVLNVDGTMDRNKIVHITYRPSTQEEKNALWMMEPLDSIGEGEEVVPATPQREGRFFLPETPPKPLRRVLFATPNNSPAQVPEIKLGTRVFSYEEFVQAIQKGTPETIPETPYNPKAILRTATGPIPIPLANRHRLRARTAVCQCNCPIACLCNV